MCAVERRFTVAVVRDRAEHWGALAEEQVDRPLARGDLDAWYLASTVAAGGPTILDLDAGHGAALRDRIRRSLPAAPVVRPRAGG